MLFLIMLFVVMNLRADNNIQKPLVLLPVINSSRPLINGFWWKGRIRIYGWNNDLFKLSYGLELK